MGERAARVARIRAGLVEALSGGLYTLFAPTDCAFARLPGAFMEFLSRPENKQTLVPATQRRTIESTLPFFFPATQRSPIGSVDVARSGLNGGMEFCVEVSA